MIRELDKHVGQVIDTIKRLGLEEDTIFVFTSDNGPLYDQLGGTDTDYFDSASGLRGRKGSLYEGGIRVPAIISWKGRITAGQSTDTLSGFEDWVPTLLELLDASEATPKNIDGVSHANELLGKPTKHKKRFLYREFAGYGGWQGVWHDRFKAVRNNLDKGPQPWELYDLREDPRELTNVAAKARLVVSDFDSYANRQHKPSRTFRLRGWGIRRSNPVGIHQSRCQFLTTLHRTQPAQPGRNPVPHSGIRTSDKQTGNNPVGENILCGV